MFKRLALAALIALAAPAGFTGLAAAHGTEEVKFGDLVLSGAFTRATMPGAPVAGGFVTITNTGTTDDKLIGGSVAFAKTFQVHEMVMQDNVMKMREVAGGLPIPAGQTVELKPGGYHVMFMDMTAPLVEGETVDVTLKFEKAGEVTIGMPVMAHDAKSAGH